MESTISYYQRERNISVSITSKGSLTSKIKNGTPVVNTIQKTKYNQLKDKTISLITLIMMDMYRILLL